MDRKKENPRSQNGPQKMGDRNKGGRPKGPGERGGGKIHLSSEAKIRNTRYQNRKPRPAMADQTAHLGNSRATPIGAWQKIQR